MARSHRPSASSSMRKPSPSAATAESAGAAVATHARNSNNIRGTLVGAVAEGMAFGTGSAVARAVVSAVASSGDGHCSAAQSASANPSDVCSDQKKAFMDCLSKTCNDISACQSYQEMLNQCRHERESQ
ncbi:hypothetical protein FI667_g12839, partial [Globisporangium splendens]